MSFPDALLPAPLIQMAHLLWLVVLVVAAYLAPWRALADARLQHVYLGAVVSLLLLWSFDAGVTPGLGFHFLGVTVFTLMFGWALAVVGTGLATLGLALNGSGGLEAISLNALVLGVVPVSVSQLIYHFVSGRLPHHVFIYIFLNGFLGGIIAAAVTVLTLVLVLVWSGTYPLARISQEYLPFLPLYLFPEGLLNGMLVTVMVGTKPQWLKTFDDQSYLNR